MSDPQVKKALKDLALPVKPSAAKASIVLADKVVCPSSPPHHAPAHQVPSNSPSKHRQRRGNWIRVAGSPHRRFGLTPGRTTERGGGARQVRKAPNAKAALEAKNAFGEDYAEKTTEFKGGVVPLLAGVLGGTKDKAILEAVSLAFWLAIEAHPRNAALAEATGAPRAAQPWASPPRALRPKEKKNTTTVRGRTRPP